MAGVEPAQVSPRGLAKRCHTVRRHLRINVAEVRDLNSHRRKPGSFRGCCNTVMRTLRDRLAGALGFEPKPAVLETTMLASYTTLLLECRGEESDFCGHNDQWFY